MKGAVDNPADSDVSVDAQLKLICCQCSLSWKGAFKVVSIVGPGLGTHKIEETRTKSRARRGKRYAKAKKEKCRAERVFGCSPSLKPNERSRSWGKHLH